MIGHIMDSSTRAIQLRLDGALETQDSLSQDIGDVSLEDLFTMVVLNLGEIAEIVVFSKPFLR